MAYADDGSLWTTDDRGRVRQSKADGTMRHEWKVAEPYSFYRLSVAPDGETFAIGRNNGPVQLWDAASGHVKAEFTPSFSSPISPDSSRLALDSWSGTEIYNAADGALLHAFERQRGASAGPMMRWRPKLVGRQGADVAGMARVRNAQAAEFRANIFQPSSGCAIMAIR